MNRADLAELHYIAAIANVPSIMAHGILCHRLAKQVPHVSVAMEEIQAIRARRRVPGGRPLHDYVNLYFCARNPMLYKRRAMHSQLCVLCVETSILDLPGTIITDGNAASAYTAFRPYPSGLSMVDEGLVFAEFWTDPDPIRQYHQKRVKCAEVLVPDKVDPRCIVKGYVSCAESEGALNALKSGLSVAMDAHLFFM